MEEKIRAFVQEGRTSVTAQTYLRGWPSFSKPRLIVAHDGKEYVVKGGQLGKAVCNEQMVARLGIKMGAPVGEPVFVFVPDALRVAEPELAHIASGLSHGLVFLSNCSDRLWVGHTNVIGNRPRFAALAVLYGWMAANDHQLIYQNQQPNLVLSVDHGHFFPGGPNWTIATLAAAPVSAPYPPLVRDAQLSEAELRAAGQGLMRVTDDDVCRAVAAPPDEWSISIDERVAMAGFLIKRRAELCTNLGVL